jgi:hypothetical protein
MRLLLPRVARLLAAALSTALLLVAQGGGQGENVLCWEISSGAGKAYLLGSVHAAREDLYPLDPAIERAFASSDTLVVEVDISQANQGEMQLSLLLTGAYKLGDSLSAKLPPEDLVQVKAFLDKRGVSFAAFDRLRPWLVALMLTVSELRKAGFSGENGIDMHFLKQARELGKSVRALESAEFQIELLSGFSDELQRLFLMSTIHEMDKLLGMVDEITAAWKRGDAATMDRMLVQSQREDERMRPVFQKLIHDRNVSMAAKVRELLQSEVALFVVVGAGHVVGEGGLVDIFSNDDRFEVRQMRRTAIASLP